MDRAKLAELLPELDSMESIFEAMEWAEDEIAKIQREHGNEGWGEGRIWRSFSILRCPTLPGTQKIPAEFVCRSHYRELLQRVVVGGDTRLPTDAEMLMVMMQTSQVAPMTSEATCLYMRIFSRAFPKHAGHIELALDLEAYESVHGRVADEHEAHMRRKLTKPERIHEDDKKRDRVVAPIEEEDAA